MQGATFTITNLVDRRRRVQPDSEPSPGRDPRVSRSSIRLVWREEKIEPRQILPLSLSYDHRIIDGADAARFLRWVCEALESRFFSTWKGNEQRTEIIEAGVVVLGAGRGLCAAFRAADLGLDVTLVDPEPQPAALCAFRGCIPSKALLHQAALIDERARPRSAGSPSPVRDRPRALRAGRTSRKEADRAWASWRRAGVRCIHGAGRSYDCDLVE